MKKHHPSLFALAALLFTSLACQALTGTPTPIAPAPTQPVQQPVQDTPTPLPPVEPVTVESQGTGITCVGSNAGISCLGADGWKTYTDDNSDLPNRYIYEGTTCPDGQFAFAHINGVVLFDGSGFKLIPESKNYSSPEGIACDANGAIWVAHFRGVSRYADGQWKTYRSSELAYGESANELVYGIRAAADGRVWVVTSRSVAVFENDDWTVYQEGSGFSDSRFFDALTVDAQGRPWAAHSNGVDVFENGGWSTIGREGSSSATSIALDAKGNLWVGTLSAGMYWYDGNTWSHASRANNSLTSDSVKVVASDSSGRTWVGTTYGLSVFDGTSWRTLLMNNSGLNDNEIKFIAITKDGPTLPAAEEKPLASITGTLHTADGSPIVNVKVEICVETLSTTFDGETPCSDQPFFLSTTTDDQGNFRIENVPMGYYVIVSETGDGTWAQLTDEFGITSERTLIEAGETHDMGTLTLKE